MSIKISLDQFAILSSSLFAVIICSFRSKISIVSRIAILCFFLPISTLYAQFDEDRFKHISIKIDGEAISGCNAIVQDHKGYIWLSTNLGLLKYDGYTAKAYRNIPGDSTSLPDNRVESLHVDHMGDIWIGTGAGLCRYNADCDCFFQYRSTPNKPAPIGFVQNMTEDQNKEMWFIQTGGLFRYEREQDSFTRFLDKPEDEVTVKDDVLRVLLADQNNNIWMGTGFGSPSEGTGLIRFNPNTGAAKRFLHDPNDPNSLLDNRVSALHEDQQGRIMVGTYKCGLHIYNPESENFERLTYDANQPNQLHAPYLDDEVWGNDPFVQIIHQDQNGGYWIGTLGKGLNYFDPLSGKRSFYPGAPNSSGNSTNNQIWKFIEDRQGILWLMAMGTVARIDPLTRKFTLQPEFGMVQLVYESPLNPGTVWVGSNGRGLFKIDLKTDEITNFSPDNKDGKSIAHKWVRGIYQENQRKLWLGLGYGGDAGIGLGGGGLDLLDMVTGHFTHFKIEKEDGKDDFSYTVYNIAEDGEGHLWLGAGAGGLFRSDKNKTEFKHFAFQTPDSTLKDALVFEATIDAEGDFWANNHGDSTLYKYDAQIGKFIPQLKGFITTTILEGEKGKKWLGTWKQGILHYNTLDGTYNQYTTKDGLPSNGAIFLLEEENGIYWIGTRNGPAKLDIKTRKISSAGLPKSFYSFGAAKGSDGRLFFNHGRGLVSFHPDQISGNPFPPEVVISDFLISGSSYKSGNPQSQKITLSNDQNDISIEYVGLHFSNSINNQYQYKLSPINDGWIDAGTERTARYANLPPNSYTFQVKAANSDRVWSEEGASFSFTINPPWWQTWWAYLLFLISAIASILGFVSYRSRALLKENKKLEESVAQRTVTLEKKSEELEKNSEELEKKSEELEKSLENLKSTQDQLIQSEKLASLGELTAGIAHEIQNPLNFVNNFSEVSKEMLEELEEERGKGSNEKDVDLENEIFIDLKENLSKISHHGNRASSIVRAMLEHSKTKSGQKELIDINALADEYLRLAYHGLRAKDNSFNVTMHTEFDESIGKVDIVSQEMGRVLLNLITNAFHAVSSKNLAKVDNNYKPTVQISTKPISTIRGGQKEHTLQISVKDNGSGIPDSIKEKIFQPFFTTKPTGEGTGLGLSLAYDIVKAHGGELAVESEVGVGTTFKINIPV